MVPVFSSNRAPAARPAAGVIRKTIAQLVVLTFGILFRVCESFTSRACPDLSRVRLLGHGQDFAKGERFGLFGPAKLVCGMDSSVALVDSLDRHWSHGSKDRGISVTRRI